MPDYLSVKEAAEKLDITQVAVRTLIQKGKLEGAFQTPNRAWVIPADSVSAYKASRRDEPKKPRKPTAKAKRETSNKKKETKKRSSRKSSSSGFGLDDILKLITDRMNKSDKPQSGNLLTTLLETFANQKRSAGSDQLSGLLTDLGQKDPGMLQDVLKSTSSPDLASLLEKLNSKES